MILSDLSFPEPEKNLLCDDQMFKDANDGHKGECLRFWESPRVFVVLGRTCREEDDVDLEACQKDNIPVLRRSSGGGTVVQGPGCLNFSLVLAKDRDPVLQKITQSYRFILDRVANALQPLGVEVEFRPICDLVLAGTEKKFSGNAQHRGRTHILHHGTILYNFDLSLISRYLKMPPKMPDYRCNRPHSEFVTNIPAGSADLKSQISRIFLS